MQEQKQLNIRSLVQKAQYPNNESLKKNDITETGVVILSKKVLKNFPRLKGCRLQTD